MDALPHAGGCGRHGNYDAALFQPEKRSLEEFPFRSLLQLSVRYVLSLPIGTVDLYPTVEELPLTSLEA